MEQFHLDDVFGHGVQFCVPQGERLRLKIDNSPGNPEAQAARLFNRHGDALCRLFIDTELATNTQQLYLCYAVAQDPQVSVKILEGTEKLRVGTCVKLYPHMTIAVVIEKTGQVTNISIVI